MNFQRGKQNNDPEINLIPMIDVLLVILIFLVVTTTYSKFAELEISLPETSAEKVDKNIDKPNSIDITVNALGDYTINLVPVKFSSIESLRDALLSATKNQPDPAEVAASSEVGSKVAKAKLNRLEGKRFKKAELTKAPEYYILYYSASW